MKRSTRRAQILLSLWERIQANETIVLSIVAVLIGVGSGVAVWLFKELIDLVHALSFGRIAQDIAPYGRWAIALLPAAGGLIVGLIVHFFVGQERHHGVAGVMEAVALGGGRLRHRRIPAKSVAAAVSIGSGASVGPEDPSVQIGANLGSMFGQWLHLSDERMRALVAAGSAAGIAAAFNAPIAGVFFALEIILGEIAGSAFGLVVISAVASAVFTQAVSGPEPAFHIPPYAYHSPAELPFYLALGLLCGPIAAVYIRMLYRVQDLFHHWRGATWLKSAAAGLLVGSIGIFLPQIFGVGYNTIERILAGEQIAFWLLVTLVFVKMTATAVSIAGGFMGGVFAPSLFLGATLGSAFGFAANNLFPSLLINPPAFALVGMAAVLAGAVHAPLTAILLLFEMTNDYRIILPLMFSVAISLLISQRLQRDSVYTLGLARKGIRLERGRDVEILESIQVHEVMQDQFTSLRDRDTLAQAYQTLNKTHHHGLPVLDEAGELVGIITLQDIDRLSSEGDLLREVGQVCTRELIVTYPDESIAAALQKMSLRDLGRLPVVARDHPRKLVGILRRSDIIRAYNLALTRRAALRHRAQQVRLGSYSSDTFQIREIAIDRGAPCAGRLVKDVNWPRDCVLASIRRGQDFLIPHGDTRLLAGDVIVAVAEGQAVEKLERLCRAEVLQAADATD